MRRTSPSTPSYPSLYALSSAPYTATEAILRLHLTFRSLLHSLAVSFLLASVIPSASRAQQAPQEPSEKPTAKPSSPPEKSENPYQIELLETRYRFEANGDSRKEVHTRVHINNEPGLRQFARVNFDYNRSFQSIEIPLVHITHPGGGTADILPSAITDNPNPAVVNAPAYQDVRVTSVRILGLAPGDVLEYRIITTTTHHPLAPDFWLDHSFDRSGIVSHEIFELDLPALPQLQIRINPSTPAHSQEKPSDGNSARSIYHWERATANTTEELPAPAKESGETAPDVVFSTAAWETLSVRLDEALLPDAKPLENVRTYQESVEELSRKRTVTPEIASKALELTKAAATSRGRLEAIYDFVSQKIRTIDLPLGATGFKARPAKEALATGYATQEDKFVLFAALATAVKLSAGAALTGYCDARGVPRSTVVKHLLISVRDNDTSCWLDPTLDVAPFGMISSRPEKPKFVDCSKKPVHIPALLPQLGLPDLPAKAAPGAASLIELGTPLEVDTQMTLHLPPGTTIAPPTGTSVQRDYATFASQYSVKGPAVTASRHIHFLLRQVPADRTVDYNAFLHAVQNDQAQAFTLDSASPPAPKPASS